MESIVFHGALSWRNQLCSMEHCHEEISCVPWSTVMKKSAVFQGALSWRNQLCSMDHCHEEISCVPWSTAMKKSAMLQGALSWRNHLCSPWSSCHFFYTASYRWHKMAGYIYWYTVRPGNMFYKIAVAHLVSNKGLSLLHNKTHQVWLENSNRI